MSPLRGSRGAGDGFHCFLHPYSPRWGSKTLPTEFGITVNAVAPGLIETDMLRATTILDNPIQQEVPLGWLGQPEHIAHCVLFLLENEYMTGQVINISGGRLIAI
jgi:NAD(P)-dependent dehydrogenase (short-subunit alcohol dehydrogenase family)